MTMRTFNVCYLLSLAVFAMACGGGAGHGAEADGPAPSGNGPRRALELTEADPQAPAKDTPATGDGTSTPEIVKSVEQDRP
jgi:hypothetical protein